MSLERAALVTDGSLEKQDGVQRYVTTLGQWLAGEGIEVHYLSSGDLEGEMYGGVVHSLAVSRNARGNGNEFSAAIFPRRSPVLDLIRQGYFDVIHLQLPHGPFVGERVIRHAHPRTALIGTYHLLPYSKRHEHLLGLAGFLSRRSVRRLRSVVVTSTTVAEFAERVVGRRCDVVPVPVTLSPESEFRAPSVRAASDKRRVSFVGRLVVRKGCSELLRAVGHLSATEQASIDLTIVGDGPERSHLEEMATSTVGSANIQFVGAVSDQDKQMVLRESDVAVFPAISGESFGIVLIEAMLCRVPVLAGDNPGYRSTMKDFESQLVVPRNTQQLARRMLQLISLSEEEREEIVQRQEVHAGRFRPHVVGAQLLELYERSLRSSPE